MTPPRSVAVVGATGACGRQLVTQLLHHGSIDPGSRLEIVAHAGHASEHAAHGVRADLRDAYADHAPDIDLVVGPEGITADVVVMLAGETLPLDPRADVDRARLARVNRAIFTEYADALAQRSDPPLVVVQSNPVELGVDLFGAALGRHRVVGAAGLSDTLRLRREIAHEFEVRRQAVSALALGQHGDHLVPVWSSIRVEGTDATTLADWVARERAGRALADLPAQIATVRTELLALVADGEVHEAYRRIALEPVDVRAAVKPFLVHYTTGHTTEIVTAHSVAEIVEAWLHGTDSVIPAQVVVGGELGFTGAGGLPVRLSPDGWSEVVDPHLDTEERAALERSFAAIALAIAP